MQDRLHRLGPRSTLLSQICADQYPHPRNARVPSDRAPSLPNTCSPRRPQAARRSARSASWCARLWTLPRRSRRWARQRLRRPLGMRASPPPRASTRTAGHWVVTRADEGRDRPRPAHRSASRRYTNTRRAATDPRPAGAWSGRTGTPVGQAPWAPRAPSPSGRLSGGPSAFGRTSGRVVARARTDTGRATGVRTRRVAARAPTRRRTHKEPTHGARRRAIRTIPAGRLRGTSGHPDDRRRGIASKRKRAAPRSGSSNERTGGDLLSQAREGQVPSALWGLTALFGMGRGVSPTPKPPETCQDRADRGANRAPLRGPSKLHNLPTNEHQKYPSSPRPISTGPLRTLLCFQIRPINLVVFQGSYSLEGMGELISRPASRLDAFSGYPIRT